MSIDKDKFEESKSTDSFFISKYVFLTLGNVLAKLLIRTRITPNQVTIFWGLLMIICSISFVFNDCLISTLAGIGWIIAYALDDADGTIARYKNIKSKRGKYYDLINHRVTYPLLMFCIGLGLWYGNVTSLVFFDVTPDLFLITGFLAGLGMLIIMDLGECYNKAYPEKNIENDKGSVSIEGKNANPKTYYIFMSLNPLTFTNMMFLIPIFAVLNLLNIFIVFYGIMYPIAAFIRYIILARSIPARITE